MNSIVTVITAAPTHDLTTKETVKAELGIGDGSEDEKIRIWIRQASGVIAAACGRVFGRETVTEAFRIEGCRSTPWLSLSRYPVSSVDGVTVDGTALVVDDYEIDPDSGLLYRLSSSARAYWDAGRHVVTYTGGYALLDGLPYPLERGAIALVKQYRFSAARDPLLKGESVPGVGDAQYWVGGVGASALPQETVDAIGLYRRMAM